MVERAIREDGYSRATLRDYRIHVERWQAGAPPRDYVALGYAADNILSASNQLVMLWAGDTPEERSGRIRDQLEEATADLERATIRLRLEEGTGPLIDAYRRVRALWFTYQDQVPEADQRRDHTEVGKTLAKMDAEVEGIISMAKTDLDQLSQAI